MLASSSFGRVLLDVHGLDSCRTRRAELRHGRSDDLRCAAAARLRSEALRPEGDEVGPSPVNVVVTSCVPPNTGVVTLTLPSATSMSVLFVSTGLSSFTERRDSTSRPS